MRALVLNLDFTPLSIVSMRRAITLSLKEDAPTVLQYYDREYKYERGTILVPAVFHISKYVKINPKTTPSKRSVLNRDGMLCQYCGCELHGKMATVDHIKPVSRFSRKNLANTWDNMVAACKTCNHRKGNRTPKEAGMPLLCPPREPRYCISHNGAPEEWRIYID